MWLSIFLFKILTCFSASLAYWINERWFMGLCPYSRELLNHQLRKAGLWQVKVIVAAVIQKFHKVQSECSWLMSGFPLGGVSGILPSSGSIIFYPRTKYLWQGQVQCHRSGLESAPALLAHSPVRTLSWLLWRPRKKEEKSGQQLASVCLKQQPFSGHLSHKRHLINP